MWQTQTTDKTFLPLCYLVTTRLPRPFFFFSASLSASTRKKSGKRTKARDGSVTERLFGVLCVLRLQSSKSGIHQDPLGMQFTVFGTGSIARCLSLKRLVSVMSPYNTAAIYSIAYASRGLRAFSDEVHTPNGSRSAALVAGVYRTCPTYCKG